jgi:nucleoside-diphosphate-sugar epimerase
MVIGTGLVANAFLEFATKKDVLIFASGVSNSKTNENAHFERELNLIKDAFRIHKNTFFVYFSTCSIYDPEVKKSLYVQHKLGIEHFISTNFEKYLIFRLSNLVGRSKNPHTITNFIANHFFQNKKLPIWKNAERNLTDIDDVLRICSHFINDDKKTNSIFNIANPVNYKMIDIVSAFEIHLHKEIPLELFDIGASYKIPITETEALWNSLVQMQDFDYLNNVILKYYGEPNN